MTIHEEIRRYRTGLYAHRADGAHQDESASAAETAIYEIARTHGYLTTQAARIAANYGRSLNL